MRSGGVFIAVDALFPVMDFDTKWNDLAKSMSEFNHLVAVSPDSF
ncbi:hypothetical protein N752_11395 [Desulforamulus aquiferis]|nr:hypothetical protein N752_11395 [Desulforamulus aquiferis]